jgi:tRNA threonylcarbamoyladenosine biosynthesis protein TsaE
MIDKYQIKNESDLKQLASDLLRSYPYSTVFAFYGRMGSGKTTLIKEICNALLKVNEYVTSPTFAIINEYSDIDNNPVFHFDFYRIKGLEEAMDLGLEDYFYSGYYCFIEWPEIINELLPENYVEVKIEVINDEKRIISYKEVRK